MINWLINSTLCSGMLLMVYQLLLKNTSLFNFNRGFLLFSIVFSLSAPLIVVHQPGKQFPSIPTFQQVPETPVTYAIQATESNGGPVPAPSAANVDSNYTYFILAAIYGLVTLLLLFRFFSNLFAIIKHSRHKEKVRYDNVWLVLSSQELVPHTFLNRIFLNKQAYDQHEIEKGIIGHEMAHARQYHSIDVIFIGLIQAICWFNPLFILFRRAIQLNHEFIADAAALRQAESINDYQSLLLGKASLMSALSITSQFNYSITKKRLIMMTKHTSAAAAWLTRLAIIPVVVAAFILFCSKAGAQQPVEAKNDAVAKPAKPITTKKVHFAIPITLSRHPYPSTPAGISAAEMDDYITYEKKYAARRLSFDKNMTTDDEKHLEQLYQRMSPEQQKDRAISFSYPPDPLGKSYVTRTQLAMFKDPVQYGVWIDDKRVDNTILKDLDPKKFCVLLFSRLTPVAVKNDHFHYQVNLMTKPYYKKYVQNAIANRNHSMIVFHMKS